ncbi:oligosaccharide flippase family protein [bacterium]|nr:oligosaccharide flippase family protein [bacterium]
MFQKIKILAQQSAVYGVGTIAARAVAFLLLPYYSHLMTPAEYGIVTLFNIMIAFIQPLFVLGMDIAFLRYSSAVKPDELNRDLGQVLSFTISFGGILAAAIYLFSFPIANLVVFDSGELGSSIAKICAGILLLDTLSAHIFTYLRIKHRPGLFSLIKFGNVLLNIGLNVYLVGTLRMGAVGVYWAYLLTSLPTLIVMLITARKALRPNWSLAKIREWLKFGLPNVPSMLFIMILEFSDRKWVEYYHGVDDAGIYSAGYRIGMLMNMVSQAFRYAWQPFFMQTEKDTDARETYARVLTYFILFAGSLWLVSSLFLHDILTFKFASFGAILDERYWAGLDIFPIIMLAHIFNGIYANFMVGVYIEKKTKFIPIAVFIAASVNVVGNALLVPIFSYYASAWLTVVSYFLIAALIYFYIQPKYPIPYEWKRIFLIATGVFGSWMISVLLHSTPYAFAFKLILLVGFGVYCWLVVLSTQERNGIRKRIFPLQ